MDKHVPISQQFAAAAADCVAELRRLAALPTDVDERSGAPFFRDMAAIRRPPQPAQEIRSGLIALGMSGANVTWAAADDHLRSLEADLRRHPAPVWSTMTLARAIQDSAVFVCYVAVPEISVQERLSRIAATWLQDASYLAKTARTASGAAFGTAGAAIPHRRTDPRRVHPEPAHRADHGGPRGRQRLGHPQRHGTREAADAPGRSRALPARLRRHARPPVVRIRQRDRAERRMVDVLGDRSERRRDRGRRDRGRRGTRRRARTVRLPRTRRRSKPAAARSRPGSEPS